MKPRQPGQSLETSDLAGRIGGGSPFKLAKPAPTYEIWSRSQGKKVAEAANLKSARRVVDRRDNTYGAYDHYHKKIGEP